MTWGQKQEVAGHVTLTVIEQRKMNAGPQLFPLYLATSMISTEKYPEFVSMVTLKSMMMK